MKEKADMEADISAVTDGGETVALMEPMVIAGGSRHRGDLTDLAVEVAARSAGFRRSLPDGVRTALADLVRAMNCYYSNLIEGHDTHPIDIERALLASAVLGESGGAHVIVPPVVDFVLRQRASSIP